jgi:deoxyhypusine synthase
LGRKHHRAKGENGGLGGRDGGILVGQPLVPFPTIAAMPTRKKVSPRPEDQNAALARRKGPVSQFMARHYRHFNAAATMDAAKAYETHLRSGGQMLVTLAGAMSTAELGISLAKMIRSGKVHAIVCTGANLEEDIFNLVAHDYYERVPHYRHLSAQDEQALLDRHMNRVTDTCIPEAEAMRRIEAAVAEEWVAADRSGQRFFPHEFMYKVLRSGKLRKSYQIDPLHSWMVAACERDLPIFVPGWEDATLGNMYAGRVITGEIKNVHTVRTGIEYMTRLADWYTRAAKPLPGGEGSVGFFQIGGGIAGDFPICVVPMLHQDLGRTTVPLWGYFCQISDSTTSYGSYSGAVPNEKITWGKLGQHTPKFIIESDATIVAPLIFAWVLGE